MEKKSVRVMVQDDGVLVSYDFGEWTFIEKSNPLLSILDAVCYPDAHKLCIQDHREKREAHQRKLSTDYPDELE